MTARAGLLVTADLIFSTKVTGTAAALGRSVAVAATAEEALAACRQATPACVLVDLGTPGLDVGRLAESLRAISPEMPILAYGPHVEREHFAAASGAGCLVLARGKFSAELPQILRGYLG